MEGGYRVMIVRILGEGQFEVDDEASVVLDQLDTELESAIERGDEPAFSAALSGLLAHVREHGQSVPPEHLGPSEVILPHEGSSMDEVRKMLADEGLISG
jgi:hypothetical protein